MFQGITCSRFAALLELRPQLVIAPYFVHAHPPQRFPREIVPLGAAIEFAGSFSSCRAHLFQKRSIHANSGLELVEIVVEPTDFPLEFAYHPFFAVFAPEGEYVPLQSFLVGLYRTYRIQRPIFSVLEDLREHLDFNRSHVRRHQPLASTAANLGFAVTNIVSYGTRLTVSLDWIPPQDRDGVSRKLLVAGLTIDFRPRRDGTLGPGVWREPVECYVQTLLHEELRIRVKGPPLNLFTPEGREELLAHFEWKPFTRLSRTDLHVARLQFVRDHPDLLWNLRLAAATMRQAGLYAPSWRISRISQEIPRLMAEAY